MNTKSFISFLIILSLTLVLGCRPKTQKIEPTAQPISRPAVGPEIERPKEEAPKKIEEGYAYSPAGRRDPFKSLIITEKMTKKEELPPLQKVDASDLKLRGVIWDQVGYYIAMVETPDGKGFVVREGTIVGLNKGIIKRITPVNLTIEERFKTYLGELKIKEITLELRKREED